MTERSWEPKWKAYKQAEAEYEAAVEAFKLTPSGDEPSRAKVLKAGRNLHAAWEAFGHAFDAEQFRT